MDRALHFYTHVLGFTKTFENGTPTGFAILKRDAAELHLTLARDHTPTARNLVHLLVSDAGALHDALAAQDTRIVKALREVTPGLLGFVFADPDGNRIDVGSTIRKNPT
jgi:catechol 2,3-dioxygenase-like lactoylglutathione lyase family enzyme